MILRRLTQHVKDQNWFAVCLDFFIVVAGILIAFQITNWSDVRSDRVREQKIIERLHSDFVILDQWQEQRVEHMESLVDETAVIVEIIINEPEVSDLARIQNYFEEFTGFPGTSSQSDTYEQLVSSGDMSLISNEQLRSELVQHASFTENFIDQDRAVREWQRPYIMPIIRLRSLIKTMPLDEAYAQAGSKADLIVALDMYQAVFEGQFSQHKAHKESFTKLTELLAAERNK